MENEIMVSVIITTYKRANMLERAVESVLGQSYENIEVIVIDDNDENTEYRYSTENIMQKYKNNKKVVYVKHKKNMNGAAARNTGIKFANGSVVCFLDDDDWYLSEKVEKQLKYLISKKEYDAVYCGWSRENKLTIPKKEGDLSFELLSGMNLIYTNTIMMWKEAAINCGGWDERFKRNQEAVFLLRFFNKGYKIGVVSEALVEFDISDRSNALNSKGNEEQFELYLNEHNDIIEKLDNKKSNARDIIFSLRYRGILLSYLKEKNMKDAIRIYLKMVRMLPIRFNRDLFIYFFKRILKQELYN